MPQQNIVPNASIPPSESHSSSAQASTYPTSPQNNYTGIIIAVAVILCLAPIAIFASLIFFFGQFWEEFYQASKRAETGVEYRIYNDRIAGVWTDSDRMQLKLSADGEYEMTTIAKDGASTVENGFSFSIDSYGDTAIGRPELDAEFLADFTDGAEYSVDDMYSIHAWTDSASIDEIPGSFFLLFWLKDDEHAVIYDYRTKEKYQLHRESPQRQSPTYEGSTSTPEADPQASSV